jgi:hypothetical protein
VPTKTIGVAEVLRVPSDRSCSTKQEKQHCKYKISTEPPLHGEISKTCKKEVGSMADNTILARWPDIHNSGMKATHSLKYTTLIYKQKFYGSIVTKFIYKLYYHDSEIDKSATSRLKGKAIRNSHCLANKLHHTTSMTEMCLCYICFLSD